MSESALNRFQGISRASRENFTLLDDLTTRILTLEAENHHLREVAKRWRAKAQNLRAAVDTVLTGPRLDEVIRRSRAGQEGLLGLPWTDDPTWEGEL